MSPSVTRLALFLAIAALVIIAVGIAVLGLPGGDTVPTTNALNAGG